MEGREERCLLTSFCPRSSSALGSRESLATLSELDLGAQREVRVWPLHPSLLGEPYCFQVGASNPPPGSHSRPFGATIGFNHTLGCPAPTGNVGGR